MYIVSVSLFCWTGCQILFVIDVSSFVILLFYPSIFLCVSICRPVCVVLLSLLLLLLLMMMLVLAVVNNFDKAFINSCKRREYHSLESQLLI